MYKKYVSCKFNERIITSDFRKFPLVFPQMKTHLTCFVNSRVQDYLQTDDKLLHVVNFSWTTKRVRLKDLQ